MVVRNEVSRLPYHLAYHRTLGVDRFFFVDNGSEDGTVDFLLSQPDCHVFQTFASFGEANYGMHWINLLVERFGIGSWCLFLDADELFTFPHADELSLPDFCRFLDQTGNEGAFALLLDMYNRGPIADAVYAPGTPFLETCPHFDKSYHIRRKVGLKSVKRTFAEVEAVGGPRLRKFYPEFLHAGVWQMALHRALRKLRRHPLGSALGLRRTKWGSALPPDLTKIPLIKGRAGRHWVSNHRTTPLKLAEVRGALLHFKFFADFHNRAITEATRKQHWDGGAEYVRYASLLTDEPATTLFFEGSENYRSNDELERLGIMKSSPRFDAFAARRSRKNGNVPASCCDATQLDETDNDVVSFGEAIPFPRRSHI
nr:glycosyltransferase family 2 protein [Microvirga terricola]